jgi:hypothetical protein
VIGGGFAWMLAGKTFQTGALSTLHEPFHNGMMALSKSSGSSAGCSAVSGSCLEDCWPRMQSPSTAHTSAVHTDIKHENPRVEATKRRHLLAAVVVPQVDINVTAQLHAPVGGACGQYCITPAIEAKPSKPNHRSQAQFQKQQGKTGLGISA